VNRDDDPVPVRSDPLFPNLAIVAKREYRDRLKSRLFIGSTIVLMLLAMAIALAPIGLRYLDQRTVTRIQIVATDDALAVRAVAITDSLLNQVPSGVDPTTWEKPFLVERATGADDANTLLQSGLIAGEMVVQRLPTGKIDVVFRTSGPTDSVRSQLAGFAAVAIGILDWTAALPPGSQLGAFQTPSFTVERIDGPTEAGKPVDPLEAANRSLLGTVFVVLMLLTIMIYGMWVATGVATEKTSRVMELMISAASPRQLLIGKVVGIGGAGLTQYVVIALPALLALLFQRPIADFVLGPTGLASAPFTGSLTPGLLVAYGVFFLLGFTLFAFVYAAVGSFVSRPDDLQTLSLPLSLIVMAGYLSALLVLLGGGGGMVSRVASFLPPLSPFAMLARLMVGRVETWEVVLSVGLLLAAIVVTAFAAVRIYATGVLLYGQRPGIRAFIDAARRAQ
jgi:ABC-2 type transport system permease protein